MRGQIFGGEEWPVWQHGQPRHVPGVRDEQGSSGTWNFGLQKNDYYCQHVVFIFATEILPFLKAKSTEFVTDGEVNDGDVQPFSRGNKIEQEKRKMDVEAYSRKKKIFLVS